jgi:putative iron-regulated protein
MNVVACGGDLDDAAPTIARYAKVVQASYGLAVTQAGSMHTAIGALIAAPSEGTLSGARTAWLAARSPYGETEVFRFYGGPIDYPDSGPEGQINAWPLDEVYIDYVQGSTLAGIINDPAVTIDAATLLAKNELGGEKNIATGWHAIEFLLWGQDLAANGPGARPFTDFTTANNAARRKQYLEVVDALLIADLTAVRDAWADGATYPAALIAEEPAAALEKILTGMGSLAGAELSGERMTVAYDNKDQEDEHSCFSDNTHADLIANARGIQNVWLGRVGADDGAGLDELVRARDDALATRVTTELEVALAALAAIPQPFDQALLGADDAPGRVKVKAGIDALKKVATSLGEVATLLGITLNVE